MTRRIPIGLLLAARAALAASPSQWEMNSFSDFIKGKFDGVSLGRDGRLSVAPKLDTFFASEQPVIWSAIPGPDGALYVATGHRGRIFRIDRTGSSRLVWTADRPEVFALAIDPKGVLYAASSPDGKIFRIENGQAAEYFDPKAKYIWSLALAPDGTLYAGTGDTGQVFRIDAAGKGELYYATGQGNVTGLVLDPRGRLLAGTEPNGILYRITAKNKAFALYDSSLPEIRAIAAGADGAIYAVGLGGALASKIQSVPASPQGTQQDSAPATTSVTVTADAGGDLKPNPPEPPKAQQPASPPASPSAAATAVADTSNVEKSAIYRINPDNTVDTLWSSREENVFDILPDSKAALYFGTDQNGRIYRLTPDRRLTLVAQTNEAQVVRLLRWNGAMLAATANMGSIYRFGAEDGKGRYESPVFDAGGVGRWGKLRWQGGGAVAISTRSGNSLRPDGTWSDWSEPLRDAQGGPVASPNARFLQFRAELSGASAAIESVSAAYLSQNNPPLIRSVTVLTQASANAAAPSQSKTNSSAASVAYSVTVTDTGDATPVASTGTPTQTLSRASSQQLMVAWQADDPDGDKLVYELDFRGDGERDWKPLRKNLHDNTYSIDEDSLADGRYLFRIVASDREVNPPGSAKEAELVSSPVLIDNTPPAIRIESAARMGAAADVVFAAEDAASVLRRVEWSIDAGPWTPAAPEDGILDSRMERFRLHLDDIPAGEHVLVIRAADSGNNTGLAKVILR